MPLVHGSFGHRVKKCTFDRFLVPVLPQVDKVVSRRVDVSVRRSNCARVDQGHNLAINRIHERLSPKAPHQCSSTIQRHYDF